MSIIDRETLETLPVQRPAEPTSEAAARARYFNSGNAFNVHLPAVPAAMFTSERDAAFGAMATGLFACDQSDSLGLPFAATTPLMLARYAVIAPGETLSVNFAATGVLWYALAGNGEATVGDSVVRWGRGDVLLTPGGCDVVLRASAGGARLWLVTNEPQLAFEGVVPTHDASRKTAPVHYPADEIERQLGRVVATARTATTAGCALIFSSEQHEASRNLLPTLTLSLNTLPPGEHQLEHRHNSAAVTLVVAGTDCFSQVGAERCAWSQFATLVTPPGAPHSHHNAGGEQARFLIVQDGGLHYHMRTMDFTFLETEG